MCTQQGLWSEWRDLNSRPYGPEPYALPNCATPRLLILSLFCDRSAFGSAFAHFRRSCVYYSLFVRLYHDVTLCVLLAISYRKPNCATPRLLVLSFYSILHTALAIYIKYKIFATKKRYLVQKFFDMPRFFVAICKNDCKNVLRNI